MYGLPITLFRLYFSSTITKTCEKGRVTLDWDGVDRVGLFWLETV